ncbi:MAG: hypothetical protein HN563_02880 [Flavobacteriales bacterium]|jgi:hypothetical protein|nr:hypothetical protein [Flavobacteriales bacterium]
MRYLITLLFAALSLNAVGQGIPQLPYNPDATGDEFIGSPDLLELLTLYGEEFSSAILSEDQESAIVYMGDMAHPLCTQACNNLPGFWNMSTMADLGLVWDDITSQPIGIWIGNRDFVFENGNNVRAYHAYYPSLDVHQVTESPGGPKHCYCATKELPKAEYKIVGNYNELDLNTLASQGWKLLHLYSVTGSINIYGVMWRWAE